MRQCLVAVTGPVLVFAFAATGVSNMSACAHTPAPTTATQTATQTATAAPRRLIPLSTTSADARAAFERGEHLMHKGHLVQAKPHFEAAIAADPILAQAYIGLAGAAGGADRRKHIMRARELAAQLPDVERLWIEAAWSGASGDPSAAATAERVAELAPDDWRAHAHVGAIAEYHHEDFAKARTAYERALALAPQRATPYRGLARSLAALGDLAGAAVAVDRYAALSPGEAQPLSMKGEILLQGGRLDEAEQAFRAAIAIDPTLRAGDSLAMVRLYRGDAPGAIAALRGAMTTRSSSLEGTNEDTLSRLFIGRALVWTYVALGQLDQAEAAIPEVEAAIAGGGVDHASLRGQELRAELLAARGRWPDALRAVEGAIAAMRRAGIASPRLRSALELLHLRVALGAGDDASIERAHTTLRARAQEPTGKYGEILMAHRRRDPAAVLAAAHVLRGNEEAQAEAKLLAAELHAAADDRGTATRLRREVAAVYGLTPQMLIHRHRAEQALGSP
jgi:tetratricopeptide (TPR) repeat protein